MRRLINGILLLDKPEQMTSNGALQRVKRLFNAKKAGHTGSLDPIATGMLPICFGEATKFSQFLLESDKSYRVVAKLGVKTTTADTEGDVIEVKTVPEFTSTQIEAILPAFLGEIAQVPPMFSALKYQGKPLYELARKGIEIERKARNVKIFTLTLEEINYDELTLFVHCSKGTYIRTLIEDIGNALGCGAHVKILRRLNVSAYGDARMYTLAEIENLASQDFAALAATLLPAETAVNIFPLVQLSTAAEFYLRTGQAVRTNAMPTQELVRLVSESGRFLGIGEIMLDGRVRPHRLIAA